MAFQPQRATLVRVELEGGALVQGPSDELAQVASAEPGLVFQEEGAELAVVADEDGGGEWVWIVLHDKSLRLDGSGADDQRREAKKSQRRPPRPAAHSFIEGLGSLVSAYLRWVFLRHRGNYTKCVMNE